MPKPSKFRHTPTDPSIHRVAWWGERSMAIVILITLITVRLTTELPNLLGLSSYTKAALNVGTVLYALVLVKTVVHPTRRIHVIGLPLGVLMFGARAAWFVGLWVTLDRGGMGNIAERAMLTASTVVYHVWGIWSDRRPIP